IVMLADGSWAPSSFSGVVSRQLSGTGAGLSSAACPAPGPEWWFVGAGSEIGRGSALLVSNPAEEPARFDISLYSGAGPVQALAGKGIDLGPGATVRLRLDALAPDEDLLAIEVGATSGRVSAAVRDVAVPVDGRARGVDFLPPAQIPNTRVVVAGIPDGGGRRDLVLVNPGAQFATVTPRLLTEDGPESLAELATIAVPAGAVIRVDLARILQGRAGSLDLASDVPVTGGVRAEWGETTRDIVWLAAVPLIGDPDPLGGAAAVPSGPGLTTTVVIAAPDGEVRGTLTTVTTQSPDAAALSGKPKPGIVPEATQLVIPDGSPRTVTEQIVVPAGSQRTITVPTGATGAVAVDADADGKEGSGATPAGLVTLTWRSDPGSAPAALSHLVLDPTVPLATGYPWWPVVSSVTAVEVRADLGVLAPTG
ncbi:MAG: DUF5719 family protein, partial [Chloroflexi bacterium]|nr:DUF5719 family protein [Chloroflexota bacterium]